MRTDVKLGVVFALVMVLSAGGYFMFRGEKQTPIALADKTPGPEIKTQPAKPGTPAKTATNQPKATTTNNNRPPITPKPIASNSSLPGRPVAPVTTPSNRTAVNTPSPAATVPGANPAMPRPASPAPITTPPIDASATLASNSNPAANAGLGSVTPALTSPSTTLPASLPSSGADRSGVPGKEVGLTGNMTPLSNSPSVTPPSASPSAPTNTMSALPPGIRNPSAPKPDPNVNKINGLAQAAMERHKVQTGDSLSSLAHTYYGNSKYAKVLIDANPNLADPNRLKVGLLVNIPPLPADADSRVAGGTTSTASPKAGEKAAANGKRTYTVKPGDSFYSIAKSQLGSASRWKELLALNNATVNGDPTSLQPGQRLILPESH